MCFTCRTNLLPTGGRDSSIEIVDIKRLSTSVIVAIEFLAYTAVLDGGPEMARPLGGAAARQRARHALDRRMPELHDLPRDTATPRGGWVRAIREALGMSAADLGQRRGVAETSVLSLERNEVTHHARLDTLERAANALDCDLIYALVPRRPLEQMVDERARALAADLLGSVGHSTALEGQQVAPSVAKAQLLDRALRLRDEPGLWRDGR